MYTEINIYRQTSVCPNDHRIDPRAHRMRVLPVFPKQRVATHCIPLLDLHCKDLYLQYEWIFILLLCLSYNQYLQVWVPNTSSLIILASLFDPVSPFLHMTQDTKQPLQKQIMILSAFMADTSSPNHFYIQGLIKDLKHCEHVK